MKVVWAYRSFGSSLELKDNFFELNVFKSCLVSWTKFAPTFRRVAYFDSTVLSFLKVKKPSILEYLDEIHEVDFVEEIDKKYKNSLFSAPKMWAYTQQTEPFFICDTDVVLHKSVSKWFDESAYWGWFYDHSDKGKISTSVEEKDYIALIKDRSSIPFLESFADHTKSVNGCLFYFKDARVAQLVGHLLLEVGNFVANTGSESWILFEEALLRNLVEYISKEQVRCIPDGAFKEYCNVTEQVEQIKYLAQISNILSLPKLC